MPTIGRPPIFIVGVVIGRHRGQDKEAQKAALSAGLSPKETMRNDLPALADKKAVPVVRGHRLPSLYRTKDITDLGPF